MVGLGGSPYFQKREEGVFQLLGGMSSGLTLLSLPRKIKVDTVDCRTSSGGTMWIPPWLDLVMGVFPSRLHVLYGYGEGI